MATTADFRRELSKSGNSSITASRPATPRSRIERNAHVLLYTYAPFSRLVLPYFENVPDVEIRVVRAGLLDDETDGEEKDGHENRYRDQYDGKMSRQDNAELAVQLADWADVCVLAPASSGLIAKMLAGITDGLLLSILRVWDTSKNVVLVPEMSLCAWDHPLTEKHMRKMGKKWKWVEVLPPILWHRNAFDMAWNGFQELEQAVNEVVTPITIARDQARMSTMERTQIFARSKNMLPPELWSMVFEQLGDWEVAAAMGIYTTLPTPNEWLPYVPQGTAPTKSLEWSILTESFATIRSHLSSMSSPKSLSPLAIKLIFKFARTDILSYLSTSQKDIFWTTFGLTLLPTKASSVYGKPSILEWWRTSPTVLKKEYGPEAIDGASRAGFVDVLEWWRTSGLPLWYTERSLEYASAKGHVEVLEWWKMASQPQSQRSPSPDSHHHSNNKSASKQAIRALSLKVGKSILSAAQAGNTACLAWWDASGIPYSHSESVARIASTHGHVPILSLWHSLKGSKMIFDTTVLVGATKNGHVDVLEWWKRSGLRVEFKTCDIEEALEDAVAGREMVVREWWEANGLNLGVGTSEWMKVKVL